MDYSIFLCSRQLQRNAQCLCVYLLIYFCPHCYWLIDDQFFFFQVFGVIIGKEKQNGWMVSLCHCPLVFRTELHEGDVQVSVEELWEGAEYSSGDPETHPHRTSRVRTLIKSLLCIHANETLLASDLIAEMLFFTKFNVWWIQIFFSYLVELWLNFWNWIMNTWQFKFTLKKKNCCWFFEYRFLVHRESVL